MVVRTYDDGDEGFTSDAYENWDFPFKSKNDYLADFRNAEKQKYFKSAEKILTDAIRHGKSNCDFFFCNEYEKEKFNLEATVNEMQDALRKSGFSVTKNTLNPAENEGYEFSLNVRWNWNKEG